MVSTVTDSVTTRRSGLREATRRAVRAEISNAAMALFMEHGFEETTVEQVAAAVGMSGRSVFRYFATKEDIVVGAIEQVGHDLAAELRSRPSGEPAWEALRRAFDEPLRALENDGGIALARSTLLATTPSLRAAQQQKHAQWNDLLAPPSPVSSPGRRPHVSTGRTPWSPPRSPAWTPPWTSGRSPRAGESLDELLDTAIAAVTGGG